MNPGWTCFQCEVPNALTARHCSACGAQRPPVVQPLDEPEAAPTEFGEPADGRSDMLSGLVRLVRQASSGALTPAAFAERMRTAHSGLDQVFAALAEELCDVPGGDGDYARAVETGLEDAGALFKMALSELEGFGEGGDPARLRLGMLVAEKAEEHYQSLLAGVREAAVGHRYSGEADLVRRSAGAVLEGSLPLEDYRARLVQIEEAVKGWLKAGGEQLAAGFAAARQFDGVRSELLDQAGSALDQASQDLGRVILAIHDPEVTREAARQILEEQAEA